MPEIKVTENDWIEYYEEGKLIHRKQTLDEYLEGLCQCCLENAVTHEVTTEFFFEDTKGEFLSLCDGCIKLFAMNVIDLPDFSRVVINKI